MKNIVQRNNVRISGNGDQYMIFANGFGCDQNVWRHVIPAFRENYKVVLFDYVGTGQSDLSAYDSTRYENLDGYALDILEICEELLIKDAILVGHSVSCMIGVKAALLKPDLFSQLIFVAPSPSYTNDGDYTGGFEKEELLGLFEVMDNNYLGWSSMVAPLIMGNKNAHELSDELNNNFCANDPNIAAEFGRVTFFSDSRVDLPKLTIPSLTLQCLEDMLAPLAVGEYIHRVTPFNTLRVLKATGHCPHMSAPQETIDVISSYLMQSNHANGSARI